MWRGDTHQGVRPPNACNSEKDPELCAVQEADARGCYLDFKGESHPGKLEGMQTLG